MTSCQIEMVFLSAAADDAVRLLQSVIGPTSAKPACRSCTFVCEPGATERRVVYHENWDCEGSFKRHVHSGEFRRVLLAMELSCHEPRIVIENPAPHTGFDYLWKLWNKQECMS